jgi:uncharacterized membrane protein
VYVLVALIAFTGFVTSVVLLLVQFGASEFSARFVAWFRRDRTLIFALSTFSATFLLALVSTAQMGRQTATFVPSRTLIAALLLTLLSILMFLLLMDWWGEATITVYPDEEDDEPDEG